MFIKNVKYKFLLVAAVVYFLLNNSTFAKSHPKPKIYKNFATGFYVNALLNRSVYNQPNFYLEYKTRNPIQPALGINLSKGINSFIVANASFGVSKAKYTFKFENVNGEPRLVSNEIGFLESKIDLNFILNPKGFTNFYFVGIGAQGLYRLYSDKIYVNEEIANTNWPLTSVMPILSLGTRNYFNSKSYIQPSLNFRFQPLNTVIFDRTFNQVSIGIIIGGSLANLVKSDKKPAKTENEIKRKL